MAKKYNLSSSLKMAKNAMNGSLVNANGAIVQSLPIDKIVMDENNEYIYQRTSDGEIQELAKIIQKNGFDTPIGVYDLGDGTYQIFSGHRRWLAMKFLGEPTVPCNVYPLEQDPMKKFSKLVMSNLAAKETTPMQIARMINAAYSIIEKNNIKGDKRAITVEILQNSISKSAITKYKSLNNFIPSLQDKVEEGKLAYTTMYEVWNKFSPNQEEQELLNQTLNEKEVYTYAAVIEIMENIRNPEKVQVEPFKEDGDNSANESEQQKSSTEEPNQESEQDEEQKVQVEPFGRSEIISKQVRSLSKSLIRVLSTDFKDVEENDKEDVKEYLSRLKEMLEELE